MLWLTKLVSSLSPKDEESGGCTLYNETLGVRDRPRARDNWSLEMFCGNLRLAMLWLTKLGTEELIPS